MTTAEYDVVIVGAGSGGVSAATALAEAGRRVALIGDDLIGGECPFLACMPSKSLLRSAQVRRAAAASARYGATAGPLLLADPALDWTAAITRRDSVANHRDDTDEARSLRDQGVTVIRGHGVLLGADRVGVGDQVLSSPDVILDAGSAPIIPPVDGLSEVPLWTSADALTTEERPSSLAILGAGPIGCELAQVYATFGTAVTVVDVADAPAPREDPELGAALRIVLEASGVRFRLGSGVRSAEVRGAGVRLHLDGGGEVDADRVLVVTGRRPATDGLGLDAVGVTAGEQGEVRVDARCRVVGEDGEPLGGLWAVGDVTGVAPYTHAANHQAAVVVDEILGRRGHDQTPDAMPRAIFTDPPLAAAGLTEAQARDRGYDVVVAEVDLAEVSRAGAEGEGPLGPPDSSGGLLRLIADRGERRLLGAGAVGPAADEWIAEATLAIRARVPLEVLADVVRAFPTFAQAYTTGYRDLLTHLDDS